MRQNRYLIIVFCALISVFALNIKAQKTSDEKQLRAIYTNMDRALVAGDITVFEKYFAPDYIYSNNFGVPTIGLNTFCRGTTREAIRYHRTLHDGMDFQ